MQELRALLNKCWATDYMTRPSFPSIITTLEATLSKLGPRKTKPDPDSATSCCAQQ